MQASSKVVMDAHIMSIHHNFSCCHFYVSLYCINRIGITFYDYMSNLLHKKGIASPFLIRPGWETCSAMFKVFSRAVNQLQLRHFACQHFCSRSRIWILVPSVYNSRSQSSFFVRIVRPSFTGSSRKAKSISTKQLCLSVFWMCLSQPTNGP